jgi:hypothetical protein
MNILDTLKRPIRDHLWLRSVRRHKSRLGRTDAPVFATHHDECRQQAPVPATNDPRIEAAAATFVTQGVASIQTEQSATLAQSLLRKIKAEEAREQIWDAEGRYTNGSFYQKFDEIEDILNGDAGEFLRTIYGTSFKLFYGVLYKSSRDKDEPAGSQLWHADGGPGTCINFMYCLSPVSAQNGSMECLPWPESLEIYARERAAVRAAQKSAPGDERDARATFYRESIEQNFGSRVIQPESGPGLLYAFRNNCIHKGGFVEPGTKRYVIVFHVYPSSAPTPFEHYRQHGIEKLEANPPGPDF